mgnify:CR=1 FL=1
MSTLIRGLFRDSSIPVSVKRLSAHGSVLGVGGRPHRHDFTEVVIFVSGEGEHFVNDNRYEVSRGDTFVIEHVDSHYIGRVNHLEFIEIVFQPSFLKLPYEMLGQIPGYSTLFAPPEHAEVDAPYRRHLRLSEEQLLHLDLIVSRMYREFTQQHVGHEAALHGYLVEFLVHLAQCYPRTTAKEATTSALAEISGIIEALQNDITHPWSLDEMADIGAMSTSKLLVVFREATGMTPIDYLIRLRVRDAMFELRNTHDSVTEIAYHVGFSDSNYFARQFRKVTRMSPTEYRRSGQR